MHISPREETGWAWLTPPSPHKLLEFIWRQTCPSVTYAGKPEGEGENMNWDQIEGKWKRFTGSARDRWGKLTENDWETDRKSTRLNSSHLGIAYAVFCLKKKNNQQSSFCPLRLCVLMRIAVLNPVEY